MDRKRILIIDDEEDFTKLVKLNLEATGKYEVRTEGKGLSGLTVTKEFKPDLIFLDIMMEDMDGGEVAFQIRKIETLKNIPIVFLTATATKEEIDARGGVIQGYPFIAKPVTTDELIDCIEKNIRK